MRRISDTTQIKFLVLFAPRGRFSTKNFTSFKYQSDDLILCFFLQFVKQSYREAAESAENCVSSCISQQSYLLRFHLPFYNHPVFLGFHLASFNLPTYILIFYPTMRKPDCFKHCTEGYYFVS